MEHENNQPETLQDAIVFFSNLGNCREFLVAMRWPTGVICPRCGGNNVAWQPKYNRWQCNARHARRQFTSKTGTIFEDSPLGLDKWLTAMWMIVNCKNGVSSWEIHRAIGVTQKSAWFMLHRIRYALQNGSIMKLGSTGKPVEVDETFIGGKARNMHKDRKLRFNQERNQTVDWKSYMSSRYYGKTIVMGMLERKGQVKAQVINERRRKELDAVAEKHIEPGAHVITDEHTGYMGFPEQYTHEVINHLESYVKGHVHTNGIENFWSLLKRGLNGTYVSVEPFHLFRYVDEQVFRYNNRATKDNPLNDADRFCLAVSQIVGKRLTFAEVTGKVGATPS